MLEMWEGSPNVDQQNGSVMWQKWDGHVLFSRIAMHFQFLVPLSAEYEVDLTLLWADRF